MKYLTTESTPVKLEDFHRREEGQSGVVSLVAPPEAITSSG